MMNTNLVDIMVKFIDYKNEKRVLSQSIKINTPDNEDQMYFFIASVIADIKDIDLTKSYKNSIMIERKFVTEEVFDKVNEWLLKHTTLKISKLEAVMYNGLYGFPTQYVLEIIDLNTMKYCDINDENPVHNNMIRIDFNEIKYDIISNNVGELHCKISNQSPEKDTEYKPMFGNDIGKIHSYRISKNVITDDSWLCEHCGFVFKFNEKEKVAGQILKCKNCKGNSIVTTDKELLVFGINIKKKKSELWETGNIFVVTGDDNKDLEKALEKIRDDEWHPVAHFSSLIYCALKYKEYNIFKLEYTEYDIPNAVFRIEEYIRMYNERNVSVTWLNGNTIIFV